MSIIEMVVSEIADSLARGWRPVIEMVECEAADLLACTWRAIVEVVIREFSNLLACAGNPVVAVVVGEVADSLTRALRQCWNRKSKKCKDCVCRNRPWLTRGRVLNCCRGRAAVIRNEYRRLVGILALLCLRQVDGHRAAQNSSLEKNSLRIRGGRTKIQHGPYPTGLEQKGSAKRKDGFQGQKCCWTTPGS
jgi:hypothetical protein